jgi:hypothetical protein
MAILICRGLIYPAGPLRTYHGGFFKRAEKPSEDITQCLILMNMKGLMHVFMFKKGFQCPEKYHNTLQKPKYSLRHVHFLFQLEISQLFFVYVFWAFEFSIKL